VDAAASKVGGILLPTDERAWSIEPTPIRTMIEKARRGSCRRRDQGMGEAGAGGQGGAGRPRREGQRAAVIDEAKAKAEKAEKRIEDWMVEGQWHAEVRKVIDDCVRIGSGVLKGPIPVSEARPDVQGRRCL
jgi:hypothetical protein